MGEADNIAIPIHMASDHPSHVVKGKFLSVDPQCYNTTAKSPFRKPTIKRVSINQFSFRSRAGAQAENFDPISRTRHLHGIDETDKNGVVCPQSTIYENMMPGCVRIFNSCHGPIDRRRSSGHAHVHQLVTVIPMFGVGEMGGLEDPGVMARHLDYRNGYCNLPSLPDIAQCSFAQFITKGVFESNSTCLEVLAPLACLIHHSHDRVRQLDREYFCTMFPIECRNAVERYASRQCAGDNRAGTGAGDQIEPLADVEFHRTSGDCVSLRQRRQIRGRIQATHTAAVDAENPQDSGNAHHGYSSRPRCRLRESDFKALPPSRLAKSRAGVLKSVQSGILAAPICFAYSQRQRLLRATNNMDSFMASPLAPDTCVRGGSENGPVRLGQDRLHLSISQVSNE